MHHLHTSRIDINDNDHWQLIGARQDYGTFYSVYMILDQPTFNEETKETEYIAEFKILNYEGAVTIGFVDTAKIESMSMTSAKPHTSEDNKQEEGDFKIKLKLQAFNAHTHIKNKKLAFKYAMTSGKIFEIDITFDEPNIPGYKKGNAISSPYVDPEKYSRDGEDAFEISYSKTDPLTGIAIPSTQGIGKKNNSVCWHKMSVIM